jgi:hypothetical protein
MGLWREALVGDGAISCESNYYFYLDGAKGQDAGLPNQPSRPRLGHVAPNTKRLLEAMRAGKSFTVDDDRSPVFVKPRPVAQQIRTGSPIAATIAR